MLTKTICHLSYFPSFIISAFAVENIPLKFRMLALILVKLVFELGQDNCFEQIVVHILKTTNEINSLC